MSDSLIPVALVAAWLLTCSLVAASLDYVAMQPIDVRVEDHRLAGMSDEQVLGEAVQTALGQGERWWWVRSGPVRLVFDETRAYDIDPALFASIQHSAPTLLASPVAMR